jgi:hypothetical protein
MLWRTTVGAGHQVDKWRRYKVHTVVFWQWEIISKALRFSAVFFQVHVDAECVFILAWQKPATTGHSLSGTERLKNLLFLTK